MRKFQTSSLRISTGETVENGSRNDQGVNQLDKLGWCDISSRYQSLVKSHLKHRDNMLQVRFANPGIISHTKKYIHSIFERIQVHQLPSNKPTKPQILTGQNPTCKAPPSTSLPSIWQSLREGWLVVGAHTSGTLPEPSQNPVNMFRSILFQGFFFSVFFCDFSPRLSK